MLIQKYGLRWSRNKINIGSLKKNCGDPTGVYVLSDGSLPVYVGQGHIRRRIRSHDRSKTKSGYWDHFTWFEICDEKVCDEIEALLLSTLPFYLRSLNKQRARFLNSKVCKELDSTVPQLKMEKSGPRVHPPKRKGR